MCVCLCTYVYVEYTFQQILHYNLFSLPLTFIGMRAPSFRCTEGEDGTLILHYYSDRDGLEHIVIGIVKVRRVCRKKNEKQLYI